MLVLVVGLTIAWMVDLLPLVLLLCLVSLSALPPPVSLSALAPPASALVSPVVLLLPLHLRASSLV